MLSLLLAVLMIVGMIPMTALAAETSTITATADKTADLKKGDTVEVTFAIANNPGVCAMEANLVYNDKVLKFTGLKMKEDDYGTKEYVGILRSGGLVVNKGSGRIVWANATDVTASNTLFVAQFEVVGTGETTVSLTLDEYRKVGGAENKDNITITPSATISVASVPATEVTLNATSANHVPR